MNLIEPVTAFREMSPEVPEELLAQLETGDLPPAFADDQNPVTQLLRRYWKIRNANRTDVARALTPGTTLNKTFRRIDSILSGESQPSTWVANLMHNLNIPLEEIAAAHREAETWKEQRKLAEFRRSRHRAFRRLGPYLASIDTHSPFSDSNFSVSAFQDFSFYQTFSVLDNPLLTEVSEWISEQPTHLRDGTHITAYLYPPPAGGNPFLRYRTETPRNAAFRRRVNLARSSLVSSIPPRPLNKNLKKIYEER